MDVRYTGHHYELVDSLDTWTREQPRKGLWERNSRFYIPKVHGDYTTDFTEYVQGRHITGSKGEEQDSSIWGPKLPPRQKSQSTDEFPPRESPTPLRDNFTWGVGEDADLITLLPTFNPDLTRYAMRGAHFNYPVALEPEGPPRRATIITFYRFSNRLLSAMHLENTQSPGHHMSAEQWPLGAALHHGYKVVYAPHSVFMDREWPAKAAEFIFNNGDSEQVINAYGNLSPAGEGSGGWESVFGLYREHNFNPSTWYFRADFASRLYKRFLGHDINRVGGKEVSS